MTLMGKYNTMPGRKRLNTLQWFYFEVNKSKNQHVYATIRCVNGLPSRGGVV